MAKRPMTIHTKFLLIQPIVTNSPIKVEQLRYPKRQSDASRLLPKTKESEIHVNERHQVLIPNPSKAKIKKTPKSAVPSPPPFTEKRVVRDSHQLSSPFCPSALFQSCSNKKEGKKKVVSCDSIVFPSTAPITPVHMGFLSVSVVDIVIAHN